MSGRRVAVLDIGGTKIKGCVFIAGKPDQKGETDSQAKQGAFHLLKQASALLESFRPFEAVGISTAGQVDPKMEPSVTQTTTSPAIQERM